MPYIVVFKDAVVNIDRYLQRIGYTGDRKPDLDTLASVQLAHVCSIPFENLDVQLGRRLGTGIEAAFEKIVERRRGGWCYEQNGLFGWALAELGFDVTRVAGAVMRHERGALADNNHLCLLVRMPGKHEPYLVDVGFGGSMLRPMPLEESEEDHLPFRVGLRRTDDSGWRFWEDFGDGRFSYDFETRPGSERELAARCEQLQTDPDSSFVLNLVCQRRQPLSHVALRGRVLTTTRATGRQQRLLQSAAELSAALAAEFNLVVPEATALWPKIEARHEILFGDEASAMKSGGND